MKDPLWLRKFQIQNASRLETSSLAVATMVAHEAAAQPHQVAATAELAMDVTQMKTVISVRVELLSSLHGHLHANVDMEGH